MSIHSEQVASREHRQRSTWVPTLALVLTLASLMPKEGLCDMRPLDAVPDGFHLYFLDDCGSPGRSPHVTADGTATFPTGDVDGDDRARTVSFAWREVVVSYQSLDPGHPYVIAVTYANERHNDRVQTLTAGSVQVHGPRALPKGPAERLIFRLPPEAIDAGELRLSFGLVSGPNAVVSSVEIWTDVPAPPGLRIVDVAGLYGPLTGSVVTATFERGGPVLVELRASGVAVPVAETMSSADGRFSFERTEVEGVLRGGDAEISASDDVSRSTVVVPREQLLFEPVRYVPMPSTVSGLAAPVQVLDGEWRLHLTPDAATRALSLGAEGWHPILVPGQRAQQGYDVDPAQPVAMATVFGVPASWSGYRVFLRFDGIHGGADVRMNGRRVGSSERLFLPVEWEVTRAVRPGRENRIDLVLRVSTLSEQLSHSSGYAFHNLGGIDRSVRLFAVPRTHLSSLHVASGLDEQLRDGVLSIAAGVRNDAEPSGRDLVMEVAVEDPASREVAGSPFRFRVTAESAADEPLRMEVRVPNVRPWSAEKPELYRVRLTLRDGEHALETVERDVGFRKIEIRGAQLYVNGRPVKLAGACRHEIDPLKGRADTARHATDDVWLMKRANLNMIRTAHYPPTAELLEAADRVGMYVEVESPFCWVGENPDPSHLRAYLDPTSAMVDYHHGHPSVLLWSIANECAFNEHFEVCARLVHDLDPTRPATFNYPDPKQVCDIANLHYPPSPYDAQIPDDPRPVLLGEYNFPICHEQTDAWINPGLRELWGAGHAEPDSLWGRDCAASYGGPYLQPGMPPGTWDDMLRSERIVGGDIWAAIDDTFYLPGGRSVGYSWHHGFWGIVDAWRRPKPEWWLTKMIYSPVRFPQRTLPFEPGQRELRVPISNRFSFTDLSDLRVTWEIRGRLADVSMALPPWAEGELLLPLPVDAGSGDEGLVRVYAPPVSAPTTILPEGQRDLVTVAAITLGERRHEAVPQPTGGVPWWRQETEKIEVSGNGFSFELDASTVAIRSRGDSRVALRTLPSPHITRFDYGDLAGPDSRPYEVLPDADTRAIESVMAREVDGALEIDVLERFAGLSGSTRWRIDREGLSRVSYDYTYTGESMDCREIGIRALLYPDCDRLSWRRWSEWGGAYPEDSVSRTVGTASAHRDSSGNPGGQGLRPAWPWSLDETEHGTADFRSVKLNVYEAWLGAADGRGVRVVADADAHVRASLAMEGTWLHVLSTCRLGPVALRPGDRVTGEFTLELKGPG